MAETVTVNLTITATPAAPRIPLSIPKDVSPSKLRQLVSEAASIPLGKLRLIFRGKLIGDDEKKNAVDEYKLEEGTVLHCMGKPEGQSAAAPAASSTPPAMPTTQTAGSSVTVQLPTNAAAAPAVAASNPLDAALGILRSSNPPQTYMTAVSTLEKILNNISKNPMEDKYRRLKKGNAGFQKRLGGLTGGDASMKGAGFVIEMDSGEEVYVLHASAEKWPQLMAAKTRVEAAVREAKAAANQASAPPVMPGGMPNFGAGMGAGGMGGPGMGPGMSAAAAQMMSDPTMLQNMLQNPMMQNMMRNDPRLANNPMLQQVLNNPEALQQAAAMMRDPAMQQQMQVLMNNPEMMRQAAAMGGAGGGMPGGFGSVPPFGAGAGAGNNAGAGQQPLGAGANAGGNDEELTEEEMIAEAIRRSLEEGGA